MFLSLSILACLCAPSGCGGGGGSSGSQQPPPPPEINSVIVSPDTAQLFTGSSQLFTAQVTGTGAFNPSVTWSVNGINGGNSTFGTIVNGQYTAPATQPNPSDVSITATSVESPLSSTSTAMVFGTAVLSSITPNAESAYEQMTLNGQNFYTPTQVWFSGPGGTVIPAGLPQQTSLTQLTIMVPPGAASGPVSISLTPFQGGNETTNSVNFTRLPNLMIHAPSKDLSSGETMQFAWTLLGASSPTQVNWKTTAGTITSGGLFQAPVVSAERYASVTGCLQGTQSCSTLLLRILPFRITPPESVVGLGQTVQLDAVQGGSTLTPQWSVLAGGGSINAGGLFTAPTSAAQAGPIPITATVGTNVEQTSVAVEGVYPGLVNRVYDYVNFNDIANPTPEGTWVESMVVNGNRAYALTSGAPFEELPAYMALNVYDVSNPDQPVWIGATEAAGNPPNYLFINGNNLFDVGAAQISVYSLQGTLPALTQVLPLATYGPFKETVTGGVLYVLPSFTAVFTIPVDVYDVSSGTPVRSHYELPTPSEGAIGGMANVTGVGNTLYVSWVNPPTITPSLTIATYDISTSPPTLVNTTLSDDGFELQIANQLLFADTEIYDISNQVPQHVATLPIREVSSVQGNQVIANGTISHSLREADYVVVDISNPANPIITNNVADLPSWDIFVASFATWGNNGRFYATDGAGGIAVYNVTTPGGWAAVNSGNGTLSWTYDQALPLQTLYAAGAFANGNGGLQTFDVSGAAPNPLGSLVYTNNTAFAVQVSGTNVFLGLSDSLKTVDVSDPSNPVETASVAIPTSALAMSGNTLYAGTSDGHLVVLDVSSPTALKTIATIAIPAPLTMKLLGTLLYAAAGPAGMLIVDISNPTAPALISQFSLPGGATVWDVSPQGSFVVLAGDSLGLVTVDVSTPAHPQQLAQFVLPLINPFPAHGTLSETPTAISLALQNGITYLGTLGGLEFGFDASVPANPRLVTFNAVGADDMSLVSVITPGSNNLYLGMNSLEILNAYLVQLENSAPRNSIELYYPPAALSNAVAVGSDTVRAPTQNLKLKGPRVPSTMQDSPNVDRFGFSQAGRGRCAAVGGGNSSLTGANPKTKLLRALAVHACEAANR